MITVSAYCYLKKYQAEHLLLLHVTNDESYTYKSYIIYIYIYKLKISNKFKDIDAYYFFDDIINIKHLDPHKMKIDEKL